MKKQLLIGIACLGICLPIFSMNSATEEHEANIEQEAEPINNFKFGDYVVRSLLDQFIDSIANEKLSSTKMASIMARFALFMDGTFGIKTYLDSYIDFREKKLKSPEVIHVKNELINELLQDPAIKELIQKIDHEGKLAGRYGWERKDLQYYKYTIRERFRQLFLSIVSDRRQQLRDRFKFNGVI